MVKMSFEWTTFRIFETLGLPVTLADTPVTGITTDSRAVKAGNLFVAIKGDTHDGHVFIPQAFSAGAVAVLSEVPAQETDPRVIVVPSTLDAIRTLAGRWRRSFDIPFIAIVGAVGKTTTKELSSSILEGRFGRVLKTEGSQNGFLGVALTLLRLRPEDRAAVIEIGIDDIGAMDQHLALVAPTHVLLTRTGPEHLHQLKTVEIAAQEELRAFDHALEHGLPLAVNVSDPFVKNWWSTHQSALRPGQALTYSMDREDGADHLGIDRDGTIEIVAKDWSVELDCPLPGIHHAHNLLAAVTLSRFFGLSVAEIKNGLSGFKTALGRTEVYRLPDGTTVIGDHYNSNPTSLAAALELLARPGNGHSLHAVLGDMLELGENEEHYHREVASELSRLGIGSIWLYGPRMKWLKNEIDGAGIPGARHFESHADLISSLKPAISPGDRILIKGSRGMRMETVLKALLETRNQ
jgi:UDP-N-acetylmuramoyl-tripeptide--D-alanyl-D-alanine ligase